MKCTVTELEIETIYRRIIEKDLNLSPEFQRGEVWTVNKKKKLIDSILRGWRIPPIHLIENIDFIDEVLDGQQRLVAIRDFIENQFSIDGTLKPVDKNICDLDRLYYKDLDLNIQRKFKKYSLTIIRLTEYLPEEPAELFYRLNQPATLTSAEQRNSYIGNTRNQIKELVNLFEELGANRETIGFSNSRMAYDDIISKFCYTLEEGNLKKKITSNNISEKYRNNEPFAEEIIDEVQKTLIFFIESSKLGQDKFIFNKLNINKATLYSWLIFTYRNKENINKDLMAELIYTFEFSREYVKGKVSGIVLGFEKIIPLFRDNNYLNQMFLIFNQRASMGSTDALSIIYRDIILEIYLLVYSSNENFNPTLSKYLSNNIDSMSRTLEIITSNLNWGGTIKK
ncbi:DUF262 domain-containing protein [Fodinisporobacter ferrooxydans]|uniref:DUF262 domain-containing protein n=1 Tax=Fodinisporobacter ferrooxydans TaxID=2901836 RepID=A0ABY4CMI4_9BACL|nr:DUF262 domain-containing protein [Alicyclobacillaceae bacterium MYW30-H2]